ncbi:MAG: aminomethyl-transferring glycine dehydrogenase subunit GcvPA [Planctomycetota bacterium]
MDRPTTTTYPYIPNSEPRTKKAMLDEVGVESVDELYADIPDRLRLKRKMDLPPPFLSECALRRHVTGILKKNVTCGDYISFLGGGCAPHYVPSICDEVNSRGEFLTAYAGEPYDDHGRFQSLFEYASMMGELLEMDVVNVPTYDWLQAAATSVRMASRITGRSRALVAGSIGPERMSKILDYCKPRMTIEAVPCDATTGQIDLDALSSRLSDDVACLYFENPSYLGVVETRGVAVGTALHASGALSVVGVDPSSLGVLAPPVTYGADIVCGDLQPLGMHMQYGGGHAGFIATRDEEAYVMEYPSRLFGICPTSVEGEYGFGDVAYDRTSFGVREEGKEWVGTAAALWGITAGVYLALMGPRGMRELGEGIMQRAKYAMTWLNEIDGVTAPVYDAPHFKEFVVRFDPALPSVAEINAQLLERGIFGGIELAEPFPTLGKGALYCVTEVHTKDDIDALVDALKEVIA